MKRALLILILLLGICYARLDSSLVGWWKLNDNAASTAVIDSIGSNAGTFSDATGDPNTNAHDTAGKVNNALIFDGTDDFIDIGDTSINVKSVSLWINQDDVAGNEFPIDLDGTAYLSVESGVVTVNGFTAALLYVNGVIGESTVTTITAGTWNHIVITDTTLVDADDMDIGRVTAAYFAGKIDNVSIFTGVLTAKEVRYLYNGDKGLEVLGQRIRRGRYSGNRRVKYNIN